jgi:hypothetical protein
MKTTTWRCGPPPATGQKQRLPGRFWHYFAKEYPELIKKAYKPRSKPVQVTLADGIKVLHMFSGSINSDDWIDGEVTTTDIREETGADIVAPYDNLPIPNDTYDLVVADPSYADFFHKEWDQDPKNHPIPKHILLEAARVTKPNGLIYILHIIVIPAYKEANVERVAIHGILAGPNNVIRAGNVFRKL